MNINRNMRERLHARFDDVIRSYFKKLSLLIVLHYDVLTGLHCDVLIILRYDVLIFIQ